MNLLSAPTLRGLALTLLVLLSACSDNTSNTKQPHDSATPASTHTANEKESKRLRTAGIEEILVQGRPALSLNFASELDPFRSYTQWLSVYDEKKNELNAEWILSEEARSLYFMGVKPKKRYTIVVKPGLTGKDNYLLSEKETLIIDTRHISAAAGFSGKGMIIPAGTHAGLPVRSVNVDRISVEYFKIPIGNLQHLLSRFATASGEGDYSMRSLLSNATHVYSADYELSLEIDTSIQSKLPLEKQITDIPGIYFAVLRRNGIYDYTSPTTYFTVSDIGLHLRQYKNKWSIFASELSSGAASKDISIRVLNEEGDLITEGVSDEQGLLSLSVPENKNANLILAVKGSQLALLELKDPALDLSEFELPQKQFRQREYFIYGPRDAYRPGERLEFSVLLRDYDGRTLPPTPITAELQRPDGVIANRQTLSPQQNGYYQYQHTLNQSAPTGKWSLRIGLPDHHDIGDSKAFLVEDFMPERIRVAFSSSPDSLISLKQLDLLTVQAAYLYGAPATGNTLSTMLSLSPARTPLANLPGFEFGPQQSSRWLNYTLDNKQLNAEGIGELVLNQTIHSAINAIKGPVKLDYRSSVFESGGRPIERNLTVYSWQQGVWPGIKARFDTSDNTLINQTVPFKVLTTDGSGTLLSGRKLKATLIKLNRNYYWEYNEDDGWHYPYNEEPATVWTQQYTSEGSAIDVLVPVEKGYYELQLTDESGNLSSMTFKIGQEWWGHDNDSNSVRPDKIKISLDHPNYAAGETIKVQLQAPRPGSGFLIVENSEGILYSKHISLEAATSEFKIRIPSDDENWRRHDLRIVTLIAQPEQQAKNGIPMRSLGIQPLPLNRDQHKLTLSLDTPAKVEPQGNLRVKISSDQPDQNMMLTIAAVDQGVLSVTNFKTPDPFAFFYQPRQTAVEARDNFSEVLHLKDLAFARQRSGGDTETLTRGGERPEAGVKIVSLFKGPVQFDANGVAEVEFRMPDFNGAVRIMATAYSDQHFGSAAAEVIVKAPVVTQLSLPRFAAYGDQTQLTLDIQNTLEGAQNLQLNWDIDGAVLYRPSQQTSTIRLAGDQKQSIQLPVIITRAYGVATIRLRVSSNDINFEREWILGLRPAHPAVSFQSNKYLAKNETIQLQNKWLNGVIADTLQLQLSASTYPSLNTAEQWRGLLQYPYGCLEQTTSRARPLAMADEQIQRDWGLTLPENLNRVEAVQTAIDRLQTMQRPEGGFGLWSAHSAEEHWLTAYVTEFFLSARDQGFEVPQNMLDSANKRLQYYARNSNIPNDLSNYGDSEHRRFAYRSYAAFVLAKQASAPLGSLRQWFDQYDAQSKSPLPLAHLAIALKLQGDGERAAKAMQLAAQNQRGEGYLGDYGSDIRDIALLLKLNIEYQLGLKDPDTRLEQLSKQIYHRRYLSTQEQDAIIQLALALEGNGKNQPWSARLTRAAGSEIIQSSDNWSRVFKGADVIDISLTSEGERRIYASQTLIAQPLQAPEKQSNGFNIRRAWYDHKGEPITGNKFKTGDFVIVRLNVSASERSPDAMVIDMLPAGFELENPGLNHSTPLSSFSINGAKLAEVNKAYTDKLKHKEYRDDRFIAAVNINPHTSLELSYLMRAVTPGHYQVPSAFVEDMYQPERRAIGSAHSAIMIEAK